jgi:hypothetical protein
MTLMDVVYPMLTRNQCREILQRVFDEHHVLPLVNSKEVGTVNAIAYWSDYFNVHPALILATMEMEQSVFTKPNGLNSWGIQALCGVVDQDTPGGRPDLLGIAIQIYRSARSYAWSLGLIPETVFGRTRGWYPPRERYHSGMVVEILPDKDTPQKYNYQPKTPIEYGLLSFCPHIGRLADAEEKWKHFIPYFGGPYA